MVDSGGSLLYLERLDGGLVGSVAISSLEYSPDDSSRSNAGPPGCQHICGTRLDPFPGRDILAGGSLRRNWQRLIVSFRATHDELKNSLGRYPCLQ